MMYPMLLEGVLKEKVWGSHHLKKYGKAAVDEKIGESWEIACHPHGKSRIKNGPYKGLTLCDLMKDTAHKVFQHDMNHFPLLVKYIDADVELSLQVHPNDEYAIAHNEPYGKTEAWYIIEAEPESKIILGTTDEDIATLNRHIDDFEEIYYVNEINVRPGELYFVPAGTIHGIGKGIVLLEIQQNSDTTFRIFDYNRGRKLHLEEAKAVIDLNSGYKKCEGITEVHTGYERTKFIESEAFTIERITVGNHYEDHSKHDFQLINCIDGEGIFLYEDGETVIRKGDSFLIPTSLEHYEIYGYCTLIKSYL